MGDIILGIQYQEIQKKYCVFRRITGGEYRIKKMELKRKLCGSTDWKKNSLKEKLYNKRKTLRNITMKTKKIIIFLLFGEALYFF